MTYMGFLLKFGRFDYSLKVLLLNVMQASNFTLILSLNFLSDKREQFQCLLF